MCGCDTRKSRVDSLGVWINYFTALNVPLFSFFAVPFV